MTTNAPDEATLFAQQYSGVCSVCGARTTFERKHRSLREGFACPECRSSLRYRGQAEVLLDLLGTGTERSFRDLATSGALDVQSIYEPGVSGPLRTVLSSAGNYESSFFWSDVQPGDSRDGVRCEDLHQLTFAEDQFDVVVSSDIMEHVRRPWDAFEEINRVLKPGGVHVFSIPVQLPMTARSEMRVDTAGDEDVHLKEPHYHGDGAGGKSLVYIDYGWDFARHLLAQGGQLTVHTPSDSHPEARKLLTFAYRKAGGAWQAEVKRPRCPICHGVEFKEGPLGRRSRTGFLPACVGCGSLERHRIIRQAWLAIPPGDLENAKALQFSRDPSVDGEWFGEFEISVYGTETSIDIQEIDREANLYDIMVCSHILEHVEKDEQAFTELIRILKHDGFLQMSVPAPIRRAVTEDWGYPKEEFHGHYRHYGIDLIERFSQAVPGVHLCQVQSRDPVTGQDDYVFFWSMSVERIERLRADLAQRVKVIC